MSEPTPSADRRRCARSRTPRRRVADPRRDDGTDPDIPVAATVMLLRDGEAGPEVLMIERPDRGSFAGRGCSPAASSTTSTGRPTTSRRRMPRAARACARRARRPASRSTPRPRSTVSVWDPPPGAAAADPHVVLRGAAARETSSSRPHEAVAAEWVRPEVLLERHGRGEVDAVPADVGHAPRSLGSARRRAPCSGCCGSPACGASRRSPGARTAGRRCCSGRSDAEYGDAAAGRHPARHRLELGALPWVYTRSE